MGLQVTAAVVNALFTNTRTVLMDRYAEYVPQFEGLYSLEPSTGMRNAYPVIAASAAMSRLSGSPEYKDLFLKALFVDNGDPWAEFIAIKRKDVELQASMAYLTTIAKTYGVAAKGLVDDLIVTALAAGPTTAWIDGVNFFAANHPNSPNGLVAGTWSNLHTGTALTAANFETVLENLMGRLGWNGRAMNFRGQIELIVPWALRSEAKRIVEQEYASDPGVTTAGGNTNVNYGAAKVRVCQALVGEPTVWYLAATGEDIKPIVIQEWRPVEMVWQMNPDSDAVFEQEEYRAKVSRGVEYALLDPHYISRAAA